jgi:hypothetical protein
LNFHSVAVVLTLVTNKNKYAETKQYKNTVNTSTHITRTPTHYKTHTYVHPHITNPYIHTPTHYKTHPYTHSHNTNQDKLKQPQYKMHTE